MQSLMTVKTVEPMQALELIELLKLIKVMARKGLLAQITVMVMGLWFCTPANIQLFH